MDARLGNPQREKCIVLVSVVNTKVAICGSQRLYPWIRMWSSLGSTKKLWRFRPKTHWTECNVDDCSWKFNRKSCFFIVEKCIISTTDDICLLLWPRKIRTLF